MEKLVLEQFDVKTDCLNGDIEEVIYMKPPQGFSDESGRVCKLLRNLYRHKSSRYWYRKFTAFLRKHDLKETSDACIFVLTNKEKRLILGIYIDDGLLVAQRMTVAVF